MKINKVIKVDAMLLPAIIGTVITGIGIHLSGHGESHEAWHNWAMAHVIFSLVFLILAYCHVKQHWGWYRNLHRRSKKPRIVTVLLSIVMFFELMTGITLLVFIDGDGSRWGHFHWVGGLVLTIIATGHILKRFKILLKGLKIIS